MYVLNEIRCIIIIKISILKIIIDLVFFLEYFRNIYIYGFVIIMFIILRRKMKWGYKELESLNE